MGRALHVGQKPNEEIMELNETPDTAVVITTATAIITVSEESFTQLVRRATNTWQQPPEDIVRLRNAVLYADLHPPKYRRRCDNCQGTGAIKSDTEETQCLACEGKGQK